MLPTPIPPSAGRACNGCTGCCDIVPIHEMEKPPNVPCVQCVAGQGCLIYADRPKLCVDFACIWLSDPDVGAHWYPGRSHMVVMDVSARAARIVHVAAAYPDMWRQEPYYSDLHRWAKNPGGTFSHVVVLIDEKMTIIFPEGEEYVGDKDREFRVVQVGTMFWSVYRAVPQQYAP